MEMDPNPPQFNLTYDVKPMDIGEGYAKGIESAGKSLSDATKGVFDVMQRNQSANDMINTMAQAKMIDPDVAKTLLGKSLNAKEQMTGMYANQWILDQANKRQLALEQGKGGVDVAVAHAKLLDIYNQAKAGNPAAVDVKKQYWTPNANQPPANQPPVNQPPPPKMSSPGGGPFLPGTRYVQRTDEAGKTQTGHLLPSGQFIPD